MRCWRGGMVLFDGIFLMWLKVTSALVFLLLARQANLLSLLIDCSVRTNQAVTSICFAFVGKSIYITRWWRGVAFWLWLTVKVVNSGQREWDFGTTIAQREPQTSYRISVQLDTTTKGSTLWCTLNLRVGFECKRGINCVVHRKRTITVVDGNSPLLRPFTGVAYFRRAFKTEDLHCKVIHVTAVRQTILLTFVSNS